MTSILINITNPSGTVQKASLPNGIPLTRLFLALSNKMSLSGNSIEDYVFVYNGQEIDVNKSLSELEINEGATINITNKNTVSSKSPDSNLGQDDYEAEDRRDYYLAQANGKWPALIIFVIDASGSMKTKLENDTRIKVVENSLQKMIKVMIRRSMRGNIVSARYRLALFTYSDHVKDVYGGVRTIVDVANKGYPGLHASNTTNTREAFIAVRNLLRTELPKMQSGKPGSINGTYPAPLVCHLTDGEFTEKYGDPIDVVEEIKSLKTPDGHVLVENIFMVEPESLGAAQITPENWGGYTPGIKFPNMYAEKLLSMSSLVPDSYRAEIAKWTKSKYKLDAGTAMFYPGTSQDIVELAFQVASATPTEE